MCLLYNQSLEAFYVLDNTLSSYLPFNIPKLRYYKFEVQQVNKCMVLKNKMKMKCMKSSITQYI